MTLLSSDLIFPLRIPATSEILNRVSLGAFIFICRYSPNKSVTDYLTDGYHTHIPVVLADKK